MTMNVPPGPHVLKESAFGCERELPPQASRERPHRVNDTAPISSSFHMQVDTMAEPAQELANGRAEGNFSLLDAQSLYTAMRP